MTALRRWELTKMPGTLQENQASVSLRNGTASAEETYAPYSLVILPINKIKMIPRRHLADMSYHFLTTCSAGLPVRLDIIGDPVRSRRNYHFGDRPRYCWRLPISDPHRQIYSQHRHSPQSTWFGFNNTCESYQQTWRHTSTRRTLS